MTVNFHPGDDLLQSYAAGHLDEPLALVVATHLALCPACRTRVAQWEDLGGALLELAGGDDEEAASADDLSAIMARLDEPAEDLKEATESKPRGEEPRLPQPLRGYVAKRLEDLPWRRRGGGMAEVELLSEADGYKTRLMRIRPGAAMPQHTHEGMEITLVLQGGFSDDSGHYLPGDVALAGPEIQHQPVADDDGECLCLAVTDAPLRLTGPVGRFLNYFIRA